MRQTFDAPALSRFPAVPMAYALTLSDQARWSGGPHDSLRQRDVGLGQASGGQLGARHFAATAAGHARRWDAEPPGLGLLYVTAGTLRFEGADPLELNAGDCAYQDVTGQAAAVSWSADFQAFEVTVPARGATVAPVETLRFPQGPPRGVLRDSPQAFKADGGPRTFFVYRDLGSSAATEGRVHAHVVRAIGQMEGGTGWHVHSMSQMFYVVTGWVDIAVDGEPPVRMVPGDAMCLANGTRHDVAAFSPDYTVFELCLPGEYSTVATPAPEVDAPTAGVEGAR
jgi:quercetin dioxygenase-like cupin family protein